MNDWDGREFSALAPTIDEAASLALFERRRGRARRHRRGWIAAAAAIVVMLGGIGALSVVDRAGRDDEAVLATPATDIEFEVIAGDHLGGGGQVDEALAVATDAGRLAQLWVGSDEPDPIDFDRWVVVAVTRPEGDCAGQLSAIDENGTELTLVFGSALATGQPRVCLLHGPSPYRHLVAIDRAALPSAFTLRLPAARSHAEARLEVELPPVPEEGASMEVLPGVDVLHVRRAPPDRAGRIRVVADAATLASTWSALGLGQRHTVPEVDFDRRIIVVLTTVGRSCESFGGFARTGDVLEPLTLSIEADRVGAPAGEIEECGRDLVTSTHVVAVDRDVLPSRFTVRQPDNERLGIEESTLEVELP